MAGKFFVWKPQFKLGIESIDSEHQEFLEIVNRLYDVMSAGARPLQLRRIHNELREYARTHFRHEEEFLERVGYPGLEVQLKQHAYFVSFLDSLSATSSTASKNALGVTKDWLLDHVLGTDRQFADWAAAPEDKSAATRQTGT